MFALDYDFDLTHKLPGYGRSVELLDEVKTSCLQLVATGWISVKKFDRLCEPAHAIRFDQ
jgi:hypothetical protein